MTILMSHLRNNKTEVVCDRQYFLEGCWYWTHQQFSTVMWLCVIQQKSFINSVIYIQILYCL